MKIGYPCINRTLGLSTNSTFRLNSYSEKLMIEKISKNLDSLNKILDWNIKNKIFFLRIGSQIIPFASHPVCKFKWKKYFKKEFIKIGEKIKKNNIRISMHPDQFVLINTLKKDVLEKSIKELEYHSDFLDSLKLNSDAKIQIHVGGVYGDKESAIKRFVEEYKKIKPKIKKRLVIENDDRLFSFKDCLEINKKIKIPIIFDNLHHECNNKGENIYDCIKKASEKWKKKDGFLMIDYSQQKRNGRKCSHTETIDMKKFIKFVSKIKDIDFDLMLEIKDKEKSALKVIKNLRKK